MMNAPKGLAIEYISACHVIGPLDILVIDDRGLSFVDGVALRLNENLTGRLLQGKFAYQIRELV